MNPDAERNTTIVVLLVRGELERQYSVSFANKRGITGTHLWPAVAERHMECAFRKSSGEDAMRDAVRSDARHGSQSDIRRT